MTFQELGLIEPIVRAVASQGYTIPTPIQAKAIGSVMAGRDVLGCAQTGTGKTGAFALPVLHRLSEPPADQGQPRPGKGRGRKPRALVLCPTRELATQIFESFCDYGRHLPLRHTAIFGGVSQFGQVRALQNGLDVLVATPGRLLDLVNQGYVDLGSIEILVLDEADRMLDMGFIHDIRRVVECMPPRRQTLLFSATMAPEIRRLADSILTDPVFVQTAAVASTAGAIDQSVYFVAKSNKAELLGRLLGKGEMERTLVFTRTKHGADKLVTGLLRSGIEARAIHGNKNMNARTRALAGFKSGKTPVLVATDIASRGIDVDRITHVINYDIPHEPESYVHRIGRTARAGASGVALSFCDQDELKDLRSIERLIDVKISVVKADPDLALEIAQGPSHTRRPSQPRQGGRSSKSNGAHNNAPGGTRRNKRRRPVGPGQAQPDTLREDRRPSKPRPNASPSAPDARPSQPHEHHEHKDRSKPGRPRSNKAKQNHANR